VSKKENGRERERMAHVCVCGEKVQENVHVVMWAYVRTCLRAYIHACMHVCTCVRACVRACVFVRACFRVHVFSGSGSSCTYGVATVSRIDKITGLFCRISSLL